MPLRSLRAPLLAHPLVKLAPRLQAKAALQAVAEVEAVGADSASVEHAVPWSIPASILSRYPSPAKPNQRRSPWKRIRELRCLPKIARNAGRRLQSCTA